MKTHRVAVLPGDGIGPEVIDATVTVIKAAEDKSADWALDLVWGEAGFSCIAKYGTNLPSETVNLLKTTAACLKGPMTTSENLDAPPSVALQIRKMFDLYANVRPCASLPNTPFLKPNIDLVIVRENTEGMYSNVGFEIGHDVAVAARIISKKASERIARFAFDLAKNRRKQLVYVHKANILRQTDGLFNRAVLNVAKLFPEVNVSDLHVDNMAMQLIKGPENFDVVVTTNLFGDILSDEAAQVSGGLGLAPSANIGDDYAMFEPVHGSAPKLAGKGIANPIGTILSAKMMLEYLGHKDAANLVLKAVTTVLSKQKVMTFDLGGTSKTNEMGEAIAENIRSEE